MSNLRLIGIVADATGFTAEARGVAQDLLATRLNIANRFDVNEVLKDELSRLQTLSTL